VAGNSIRQFFSLISVPPILWFRHLNLLKTSVKEESKMSYEPVNEQVIEYPYGTVRIEFMGEITADRVIFGEPYSKPLLGVTALESIRWNYSRSNKKTYRDCW